MATGKNEGEGSRSGARAYNEATRRHVESHDVKREAKEARDALQSPEGDRLRRAEDEGKRHAKDEDPQVERP